MAFYGLSPTPRETAPSETTLETEHDWWSIFFIRLRLHGLVAGVGHQRHVARDLDGVGHAALVLVGQLVALGGFYLEFGGDELTQERDVLVVYFRDIFSLKNGSFHG